MLMAEQGNVISKTQKTTNKKRW